MSQQKLLLVLVMQALDHEQATDVVNEQFLALRMEMDGVSVLAREPNRVLQLQDLRRFECLLLRRRVCVSGHWLCLMAAIAWHLVLLIVDGRLLCGWPLVSLHDLAALN